jgi:hypothetical protein
VSFQSATKKPVPRYERGAGLKLGLPRTSHDGAADGNPDPI